MSSRIRDRIKSALTTHGEEEQLGADALTIVFLALPFLVVVIAASFVVNYDGTPIGLGALIPLIYLVVPLGQALRQWSHRLAASWTIFGLLVIVSIAAWLCPMSLYATLLCLVVPVAAATLGTSASLAVGGIALAILTVGRFAAAPVVAPDVYLVSCGLVVGNAFLSWAVARPLSTALAWSWQSYDRARAIMDELRVRQGELNYTVKTLNEAYLRLENLSNELGHARRAAEEARRLKAEFAANISHELRTPLNLIVGFSAMMTNAPRAYGGEILPEIYRRDLDTIQRNARHLSELIDDVLDLSQIEAGRMGLVKERLSIAAVVDEATTAVSRLLDGKGIALIVDVPPDLPEVYADRTRLRQVLINLLGNAARFTDEGSVTVNARVDGGDVRVSVIDTGIGIAAEDLQKVFEEFRQLDGSIRRRAGGSGLGLAVSKKFVELHGGSIWVESRVGVGTAFHFTIPHKAVAITGSTIPGHWEVWERRLATRPRLPAEVHVVSSDPGAARLFQRYLDGYQVAGYPSPADLPLNGDGHLPKRSACIVVAPTASEAWNSLTSGIPVLDRSPVIACVLPSKRDLARELGVAGYLAKPVSLDDIRGSLKAVRKPIHTALVVDDDPDMLRLLGRMIRVCRHGCRIWLADGGDAAIAILRSRRPDVVLLDLLMPGIDGYAVLREIQADERLRDVPVIVVSARGAEEEAVTAGLIGITRRHGLTANDLMRCLRGCLDGLLGTESSAAPAPEANRPAQPV